MTPKTKQPKLTPWRPCRKPRSTLRHSRIRHRLRMIQMLLRGRYTVGELAEGCGIPSHMTSKHLRLMKHCGFLSQHKEGRKAYYQVVEPHLANILQCVEARFGNRRA